MKITRKIFIILFILLLIVYMYTIFHDNHKLSNINIQEVKHFGDISVDDNRLFKYIKNNQLEKVEYLINHGADTSFTDKVGRNSAYIAALYNNDINMFFILEKSNVNMEQPDINGYTPLMIAILAHAKIEVIEYLIHRSNVNHTTKSNISILMLAVNSTSNVDVIKLLIQNGASINYRLEDGSSILYMALQFSKSEDIIIYLLSLYTKDTLSAYSKQITKAVRNNMYIKNKQKILNYLD